MQMRYSVHEKSNNSKKARILINALVDCAKAGIKPSFSTTQMLRGLCLYLECGSFTRENWRNYHRVSEAAKLIRDSGDPDWKRHVTFEHVRPINQMYKMMLDERDTLTVERAAVIIGEYPPILITMEEEQKMSKRGFQHGGEPVDRYAHVSISGFGLRSEGTAHKAVARSMRIKRGPPPPEEKEG
jgi:hypothetical protein